MLFVFFFDNIYFKFGGHFLTQFWSNFYKKC